MDVLGRNCGVVKTVGCDGGWKMLWEETMAWLYTRRTRYGTCLLKMNLENAACRSDGWDEAGRVGGLNQDFC